MMSPVLPLIQFAAMNKKRTVMGPLRSTVAAAQTDILHMRMRGLKVVKIKLEEVK